MSTTFQGTPYPKSILVVSHEGARKEIRDIVERWRRGVAKGIVSDVLYVENDPVQVDLSKWIMPLRELEPALRSGTLKRVILMNDSFLLLRPVPELFLNNTRSDVLGLAWTSKVGPHRHIQSYLRSLSGEGALALMAHYDKISGSVKSVNDFIQKFEINLDWSPGPVVAMFEAAEGDGHPDDDSAQRELISQGYPAIKLKKFHLPDDPWLLEPENNRTRLPPSFSVDVYRQANHDLNHMTDEEFMVLVALEQ